MYVSVAPCLSRFFLFIHACVCLRCLVLPRLSLIVRCLTYHPAMRLRMRCPGAEYPIAACTTQMHHRCHSHAIMRASRVSPEAQSLESPKAGGRCIWCQPARLRAHIGVGADWQRRARTHACSHSASSSSATFSCDAEARRGGRVIGARGRSDDFGRSAPGMAPTALRRGPRTSFTPPNSLREAGGG